MHDLSALNERELAHEANRLMREEARTPFDLSRDLMLRVRVLKLSERHHLVLYTMHHIASDGWSQGIFKKELGALYGAYSSGKENPLAPLPIQYADYAQWQRRWLQGAVLEQQVSYWREQLKDLPPLLTLPTDRPRPAEQTLRGSTERFALSPCSDGKAAGVEPRAGRDVVHDVAVGVRGAAGPVSRAAGRGGGNADREPHAAGDRRADRLLRQHTGDAS